MKAAVIEQPGLENLKIKDLPVPEPGPGEVLVRLRAAALNYRDRLTVEGGYGSRQRHENLIPLGDGAGEVTALGPGASRFEVGDRVTLSFFPDWTGGPPTEARFETSLGGRIDGTAAEYRALPEHALVPTPDYLSDIEAATLPCAGVTAWSAVISQGGVGPGDVVVVQGTGGVALFALQFAKMAGAEVIQTSSSDLKLARVTELGADHGINYAAEPEWGVKARELNRGRGVDHVVELGGAATLKQSFRAIRVGGTISMIGVLGGPRVELLVPLVVTRNIRLQGVTVGSREQLETMMRAMALHRIRPVVDRVFPLDELAQGIDYLASGQHFGKVAIEI